jgi:hypothetical protein
MLTLSQIALTRYEVRRAAANDDRAPALIRADVTVNLGGSLYRFASIGTSVDAIERSAYELAGDAPFGVSIMVRK